MQQQHTIVTAIVMRLRILHQYILPQRWLSRLVGWVMQLEKRWVAQPLIAWFIQRYAVDLSEAKITNPKQYSTFNAFFTRHLQDNVRSIATAVNHVVSPADGTISQLGQVDDGKLIQAKQHQYRVVTLVGGDLQLAARLQHGSFATIYLSPKDYHRVHMPVEGYLQSMTYIPGRLFSVSPLTTECVPQLFARNERVVCVFNTVHGCTVVVMVGAMLVGNIATRWAGMVNPTHSQQVQIWTYDQLHIQQGDEMGYFQLGSTVIVLTEQTVQWQCGATDPIKMGCVLGCY